MQILLTSDYEKQFLSSYPFFFNRKAHTTFFFCARRKNDYFFLSLLCQKKRKRRIFNLWYTQNNILSLVCFVCVLYHVVYMMPSIHIHVLLIRNILDFNIFSFPTKGPFYTFSCFIYTCVPTHSFYMKKKKK